MYLKIFYYRLKTYLSNPSLFFWQLCFPFILGTLFYIAFGSELNGYSEKMNPIKVALVVEIETTEKEAFLNLIKNLEKSDNNENAVLEVMRVSQEEAGNLLEEKKVDAIITVNNSISLSVLQSKLNQSIVKGIVDSYLKRESIILNIMKQNPEKLPNVIEEMEASVAYLKESSFGSVTPNPMIQYFYALIAMACLYCCYYGIVIMNDLQGNLSEIAARRCMAPNRKFLVLLCDLLAAFLICITGVALLFVYLIYVIKVDFGERMGLVILTAFFGCLFGLTLGMLIGSISKKNLNIKISICTTVTLGLSFLSGLMLNIMPDLLERYCPIINRINPANLITDSLFCLAFYDNYESYIRNIIILISYIIVFGLLSTWLVRRRKYASL